ncbi:MAG: hypothetical protein WBM07_13865 [Chitinivibrionales bacterium]
MIKACPFPDKFCCVSAAILVWVFTALPAEIINDSVSIESKTGFDTLAGDLPGVVIAKSTPYLVVSDIYVPQGKTVIMEAGAVFLFKSFTGLHVSGTLLAHGTKDKPVVFTSENDKEYNRASAIDPAPFDWNGIYLHEDAIGSQLSYCAVLYSVDGVNALTKFIRLNPCLFLHNGRASLTIAGVQQTVTDQPYEYALSANDPLLKGVPLAILKDPNAFSRNFLRYSGAAIGLTGCIMAIVFTSKLSTATHNFDAVSSKDQANLAQNSSASWNGTRNAKNKDFASLLASISVLIIGGIGIGWSFTF